MVILISLNGAVVRCTKEEAEKVISKQIADIYMNSFTREEDETES